MHVLNKLHCQNGHDDTPKGWVVVHTMVNVSPPSLDVSVKNSKCTQRLHKFMVTCIDNVPIQGHWKKLRSVRLLHGKSDFWPSQKMLVKLETGSYTTIWIYLNTLNLKVPMCCFIWPQLHCEHIWVTWTIFWSSQLHTCCVSETLHELHQRMLTIWLKV